jgi:hypothetical protein
MARKLLDFSLKRLLTPSILPHERQAYDEFRSMTLNDVRRRADSFQRVDDEYASSVREAHRDRVSLPRPPASAPQVLYGNPGRQWRNLERHMRSAGLWTVSELSERQQRTWARRVSALSQTFRELQPEP